MASLNELFIQIGEEVSYLGRNYRIRQLTGNLHTVILEAEGSGRLTTAAIKQLQSPLVADPPVGTPTVPLEDYPDQQWLIAQQRLALVRLVLEQRGNVQALQSIAKDHRVSQATLYRWVERFNSTGQITSLMPHKRGAEPGQSRLTPETESVIRAAIDEVYLTKQQKPLKKVYHDVVRRCKNSNLPIPHPNTVRNRILAIHEEKQLRFRHGKKVADDKYQPLRGHFPGADFPLAVVQMDHTPVDIILVDEISRTPLGKPWITVAIDVYSRMVVGYYVSFDPPGALGTGMCLANAILPKEAWLHRLNVTGEWPCWGRMKKIHVDNAREFRGTMLRRACEEYGMDLEFRPVKTPKYGGHIERLLGTLSQEIHSVSGTTFSNPRQRGEYNSEKKAALSLTDFEKWLTHLIVNIYHRRIHTSLGKSPFEQFEEAIFQKTGLAARITNETKVLLDFLPYFERSIQEYGVIIDHIHYYDDALRKWIHALELDTRKAKQKRKFIFKRDPRDISILYFYDPDLKDYLPISYRDRSRPPITLWEHREVMSRLRKAGTKHIDEIILFDAYEALKKIEDEAVTKTQLVRRQKKMAKVHHSRQKSVTQIVDLSDQTVPKKLEVIQDPSPSFVDVQPFEELEYGSFD